MFTHMFMFVNIGTHVFLFANKKAAAQLPGAIPTELTLKFI